MSVTEESAGTATAARRKRTSRGSRATASRARRRGEGAATAPEADGAALAETISVAAYYRAERRGFAPGEELDDWLAAEREMHARDEQGEG